MALTRPKSATNFYLNLFCTFIFIGSFYFIYLVKDLQMVLPELALIILFSFLPVFAYDFHKSPALEHFRNKNKSRNKFSRERVITKLAGLYATYAIVTFIYWAFHIYGTPPIAKVPGYFMTVLPYLMIAAIPYVIIVDMQMQDPKDSLWHVGNFITRREKRDVQMLKEYSKAWIVKIFFGTLMVSYLTTNLSSAASFEIDSYFNSFSTQKSLFIEQAFTTTNMILFTIDLLFAVVGYIFTLKIFDSQIRSSEPTWLGWLVCIMCYQPIWGMVSANYLGYDDSVEWKTLFENNVAVYAIWAVAILLCVLIYALATIAFGIRFSNLTYRGIVTNGPYRLTKHPAYVFKNMSWWLISLPFITNDGWEVAVRNSLALLGVNFIYYMRARTEENHLSNYPEYVKYAEYMNEHSIFRWLTIPLPFLKYSKERALKSGSKIYKPFAEK